MFLFFPIGMEGGTVRFPIVGLGILLACVFLFYGTWVIEPNPMGVDRQTTGKVVEYWSKRPYLEPPAEFAKRYLGAEGREELARARANYLARNGAPDEALLQAEQAELERLSADALAAQHETLFRKLALQPSRGAAQLGWLTHLFLHAGWLHLIGNMLFLYAVALLLEDAWGRKLFLGFYLVGGLVAALAQVLLERHSATLMVGASGAVAACIGAAMVRFATRKMRIAYLVFFGFTLRKGVVAVPMWGWGLFEFGSEVFHLYTGSTPGVAVMAHLGGMAFGAAVALGMKVGGLDKTLVATDEVIAPLAPSLLADVERGNDALRSGDRAEARRLYTQALEEFPGDVDAEWGLIGLELGDGNHVRAAQRLERVMQTLLRDRQQERAVAMFQSIFASFQPSELRTAFAWQMAKAMDGYEEGSTRITLALYRRAGEDRSATAPRALVRAAELALSGGSLNVAAEVIARAKTMSMPLELADQLRGLEERLAARRPKELVELTPRPSAPTAQSSDNLELDRSERGQQGFRDVPLRPVVSAPRAFSGAGVEDEAEAGAPPPPAEPAGPPMPAMGRQHRVQPILLLGARAEGLLVQQRDTAPRVIPLRDVRAIGAGLVMDGERAVLVVLLLTSPGDAISPAHALSLDTDTGGVERLRPQVPPAEAWQQFLAWLVERTGAPTVPDRPRFLKGQYPRYADRSGFETAFFSKGRV